MHPSYHLPIKLGVTLIELLIVLTITALITTLSVPRLSTLLNATDVHGATNDAVTLCTTARRFALAWATPATVDFNATTRTFTLSLAGDTIRHLDEGALHGVALYASRPRITYSPLGIGVGASNATLIISKGSVAETLTISRLGRVKR